MYAVNAALALQSDGLTFGEVLADVPHDPAAIFTYALIVVSIAAVVIGSRRSGRRGGPA